MTSNREPLRNRRMKWLGSTETSEAARIAFQLERTSRGHREQREQQEPRHREAGTPPEK